ncbi:Unknown protein sequence [Pseudomonas savastanoi pv. phaseolicola]|uniref:Uncharacterized protein n=2 Tax=Pseudomonas savastanoi TaxID=29438 RepID=A0A3M4MZY7_PSESG|nr:Unknown protein sequence [Pseudomonas savastanoi pv. phaseolicola]KPB65930.1 Unknown protein sequence [Pseudomonas amygdali pv. mellea]RMM59458.1 hypothetical protein ALQ74_102579 [Pseudomonas savastanoi pv. glycinea]KPB48264.1 Unknown protein sequence [Pseudomonas savastanoi pv. phaseolicola]KPB64929.1 Unknown protein sequence [Pseudomonas savastanoi pv. phaseolicola]
MIVYPILDFEFLIDCKGWVAHRAMACYLHFGRMLYFVVPP